MHKTASQIADAVLTKLSASLQARRGKQYWQLLKRLYGGTDEAVSAITKSRDPFIYHGTRENLIPKILKEGLKPGKYREHGVGVFLGSRDTANLYGNTQYLDKAIGGIPHNIAFPTEDISDYLRRNPTVQKSPGGMLRLKTPDELVGKQLYPDVQRAMRLDLSNNGRVSDVAPALLKAVDSDIPQVKTIMRRYQNPSLLKRDLAGSYPENEIPIHIQKRIATNRELPREVYELAANNHFRLMNEPKTPHRRYQAQTYSRLPSGINLINDIRENPEFFIKDPVSSGLLSKV